VTQTNIKKITEVIKSEHPESSVKFSGSHVEICLSIHSQYNGIIKAIIKLSKKELINKSPIFFGASIDAFREHGWSLNCSVVVLNRECLICFGANTRQWIDECIRNDNILEALDGILAALASPRTAGCNIETGYPLFI